LMLWVLAKAMILMMARSDGKLIWRLLNPSDL
jgi:type IV secretory pathway TrbD component